MNAIEIRNLSKSFRGMYAVDHLNMTVPMGAMYIKGDDKMNAVEIRKLTKNFGHKKALKGLNMTVPVGAIYGFIGENGSGKSTT